MNTYFLERFGTKDFRSSLFSETWLLESTLIMVWLDWLNFLMLLGVILLPCKFRRLVFLFCTALKYFKLPYWFNLRNDIISWRVWAGQFTSILFKLLSLGRAKSSTVTILLE